MICTQCGAPLVEDRFMNWTARWRCLECGHLADSASVESFLMHQTKDRRPTAESDYWEEEFYLGPESFIGSLT
jgi:hypothetical protein